MRLPPPLLARARSGECFLEVGAGGEFSTALALRSEGARVQVSDVDARVLGAPADLQAVLVDVTSPISVAAPGLARDIDLVYAVRVPEELQAPCARFANALAVDLALRALKDEWADLGPRRYQVWGEGWRFFPWT